MPPKVLLHPVEYLLALWSIFSMKEFRLDLGEYSTGRDRKYIGFAVK